MRFILKILKGSMTARHLKNEQAAVFSPPTQSGEPEIMANFLNPGNTLHYVQRVIPEVSPVFPPCG